VPAVIFSILFGNFGRLPSNGQPYLVMVFTGLIPWSILSNSIGRGGGSLVSSSSLLSKIYFPRLIIPLASMGSVIIDTGVSLVVLILLLSLFGITTSQPLLLAPLFLLSTLLMGVGVTLFVSSINVYYRDFGHMVPLALQVWYYMTPVFYSSELIPAKWHFIYSINPAVGLVEGFRWSILGGQPLSSLSLCSMMIGTVAILAIGMATFQRIEKGFADIV
jgi:lipopolysaccharide transport system permease protein